MTDYTAQRDTYKLLEKLTSRNFKSELALLKSLIHDIVEHNDFEITGGRIWELLPENHTYVLRYQYGNVKRIPDNYVITIEGQPIVKELSKSRTHVNFETDQLLVEKGITLYSVTGVGDLVKLDNGKFYQFMLGFNAPEILQSFFETLNIISSVATVALRNLAAQLEQNRIKRDVFKASEIQKNLLPDHHIRFLDYDIYGISIPDKDVGGDYFDYLHSRDDEEDSLGIVISDAVSKGMPAAIQALFVSGAIRMGKTFGSKISHLFNHLNTLIFKTFPYERFVTMFYCELTASENRMVLYANAGHCEPIHYSHSRDRVKLLKPTGGFLGLIENQKFMLENTQMRAGDVIVLYTDGIIEAIGENGELYGYDRLIDLIKSSHTQNSKEIAYLIIEDVQRFSALSEDSDDKTIVVIKRDKIQSK